MQIANLRLPIRILPGPESFYTDKNISGLIHTGGIGLRFKPRIDSEDATLANSRHRDALAANMEDTALPERELRNTAEVDDETSECGACGQCLFSGFFEK
jgi:hypothetical protein